MKRRLRDILKEARDPDEFGRKLKAMAARKHGNEAEAAVAQKKFNDHVKKHGHPKPEPKPKPRSRESQRAWSKEAQASHDANPEVAAWKKAGKGSSLHKASKWVGKHKLASAGLATAAVVGVGLAARAVKKRRARIKAIRSARAQKGAQTRAANMAA